MLLVYLKLIYYYFIDFIRMVAVFYILIIE